MQLLEANDIQICVPANNKARIQEDTCSRCMHLRRDRLPITRSVNNALLILRVTLAAVPRSSGLCRPGARGAAAGGYMVAKIAARRL